jgi:hypothetical protein
MNIPNVSPSKPVAFQGIRVQGQTGRTSKDNPGCSEDCHKLVSSLLKGIALKPKLFDEVIKSDKKGEDLFVHINNPEKNKFFLTFGLCKLNKNGDYESTLPDGLKYECDKHPETGLPVNQLPYVYQLILGDLFNVELEVNHKLDKNTNKNMDEEVENRIKALKGITSVGIDSQDNIKNKQDSIENKPKKSYLFKKIPKKINKEPDKLDPFNCVEFKINQKDSIKMTPKSKENIEKHYNYEC